MKSPLKDINKTFSLQQEPELNTFVNLGLAPNGRQHIALFYNSTLDYKDLTILVDTKMQHSVECVQYLIESDEETVVGSLFIVNAKKLILKQSSMTILDSTLSEMLQLKTESFGGTYAYSDNEGSLLLVPDTPNINKFVVL